ncbi:MAG: Gfo/Idh/MocA family oxidoreductase [Promethearchaeota archaeon]
MARPLNFAVVGVGAQGSNWCRRLQKHPETNLVATVDCDERRAKAVAERTGAPAHYKTPQELFKQQRGLDAVVIATPHYLHAPFTVLAAENDVNVLCEKPMAITLQQCDEMIIAARKNCVKLAIGHQHRFDRVYEYLYDAMRGAEGELGSLGTITDITMTARHYRGDIYYLGSTPVDPSTGVPAGPWRGRWLSEGGGILINQAIHDIDFFRWITGPVESLSAHASTLAPNHALIEVEDTVTASFRLKSGALGTMVIASSNKKPAPRRIVVHGTEGHLILEGNFVTVDTRYKDEEDYEVPFGAPPRHNLLENFVDAIREDKEPMCPGEEGRKAIEVVRAILLSNFFERTIRFPVRDMPYFPTVHNPLRDEPLEL